MANPLWTLGSQQPEKYDVDHTSIVSIVECLELPEAKTLHCRTRSPENKQMTGKNTAHTRVVYTIHPQD